MNRTDHYHYFVDLVEDVNEAAGRQEVARRRAQKAQTFIQDFSEWLHFMQIEKEVSNVKVTALGLIMITCTPDVIEQLQEFGHPAVASISGAGGKPNISSQSRFA